MDELQKGEILIYQSESGDTKIDVYLDDGTVWLSQALIAGLYQTTPQNIIMHTRNIYKDGELDETATCKQALQVQIEGNPAFFAVFACLAAAQTRRTECGASRPF